jgi:hypothetical protein
MQTIPIRDGEDGDHRGCRCGRSLSADRWQTSPTITATRWQDRRRAPLGTPAAI